MNREQCERATALFKALDGCDKRIAGATNPDSIKIVIEYGGPDNKSSLAIKLDLKAPSSDEMVLHRSIVAILGNVRELVCSELAKVGATVPV